MPDYKNILTKRKSQHLFRVRKTSTSSVRFCSNDYLCLSKHPKVVDAFEKGAKEHGVGSTASQLICGYSQLHQQLEQELAAFFNKDKAILFSAGFMANLGILTTLIDKNDIIIADKLCHASIIDGAYFSAADFKRFRHNDMSQLNKLLQQHPQQNKWIVTEGIFSMDGDTAPLDEIIALKDKYSAKIILDNAHGFGVFDIDLTNIDITVGTFGKAFGGSGAFVMGDNELIEYLVQFCRPFIYTTALPPAMANAMLASLKILRTENWRQEKLNELIQYFRSKAEELNLPVTTSNSPIQPIIIGDAKKTNAIGEELFKRGFWVGVIRPPTVPLGTSRLRIGLNVEHTKEQIDRLLGRVKVEKQNSSCI